MNILGPQIFAYTGDSVVAAAWRKDLATFRAHCGLDFLEDRVDGFYASPPAVREARDKSTLRT